MPNTVRLAFPLTFEELIWFHAAYARAWLGIGAKIRNNSYSWHWRGNLSTSKKAVLQKCVMKIFNCEALRCAYLSVGRSQFPGTDRSGIFYALAGMRRVSGVFAGQFILLA